MGQEIDGRRIEAVEWDLGTMIISQNELYTCFICSECFIPRLDSDKKSFCPHCGHQYQFDKDGSMFPVPLDEQSIPPGFSGGFMILED